MTPILGITASQMTGHLSLDAFDSIATISGSGLATGTFSSIPQTYKSLHLRIYVRDTNGIGPFIRFNGDSTGSYGATSQMDITTPSTVQGSSSSTTTATAILAAFSTLQASYMAVSMVDILDYTSTSKNKNVGVHTTSNSDVKISGSEWVNTSAITSITVSIPTGTWGTGTTFELYGVK
jgi:hypothetical protein